MNTEIFYFSGTGNSLHAARELQNRLPGAELLPIARLLRGGEARSSASCVGLVFPSFCQTIPIPVYHFLKMADLSLASYIFALCTRGGSSSQAFDFIDEILRKKGNRLNAGMQVSMPWNDPVAPANLAARAAPDVIAGLEKGLSAALEEFSRAVLAREDFFPPDDDFDLAFGLPLKTIERWFTREGFYKIHEILYPRVMKYRAGEGCGGCGTCEKVCPSGKIELAGGRPRWKKEVECYACFACINYCPKRAIQVPSSLLVKSATEVNARYHHPDIAWREIAAQKGAVE